MYGIDALPSFISTEVVFSRNIPYKHQKINYHLSSKNETLKRSILHTLIQFLKYPSSRQYQAKRILACLMCDVIVFAVVPPTPLSSRAVRMDIDLSTLSSTPTQAPPPSATASASASACSTHGSLQNTPSIDSASSTSGSNAPSSTQATSSASASISAPLPKVASAPTAFTIAFDNPSESVSLQDAARKSIQVNSLFESRSIELSFRPENY